ncbi:methyltransferase family protein [Anaerosporomusa subterranea]|uniref:methyltransferase family protein n=1 Tax=Anaerosporomusa subterranea TaxID=1794912 RepID=UPI0009EF43F9|nr:isoprenylcysteine carboxylmethyltransferase family protein [Anaerosporomusa subterranea]
MSLKTIRIIANGIITLYSLLLIVSRLMSFSTSSEYWLWGIPALLITLLDIYFLTKSMLREPKRADTSTSTILISVSASLVFCLSALVINYPVLQFPGQIVLHDLGKVIALLPYPFILWALLCLKDCLTIIPEAHSVVARGVYKYSRHPLYMCYIVWAIANMMMFPSWPMLAISIGHIVLLVMRFKREEDLLLATFPEYLDYYSKTGLIGKWRFTFLVGE